MQYFHDFSKTLQEMLFFINFSRTKSVIMRARTKEDQKLKFPSFHLSGQDLDIVTKVKYLEHIIRNDLNDDDDIQHQ